MATAITNTAAGAVFGAALSAAGVASPSVILSQLRLENFHMFEVFLTATGCSALIIHLTRCLTSQPACPSTGSPSLCQPRSPSSWGWFPYDGNIIGSLIMGVGMALTGSCPGTVMVQVGMGLRSGYLVLAGSLVGGILFSGYSGLFKKTPAPKTHAEKKSDDVKPAHTLYEKLETSELVSVLTFWAAMVGFASLAKAYLPGPTPLLNPLIGGTLMATSQAASIALTKNTLGVSAAYSTLGSLFWRLKSAVTAQTKPREAWPAMRPIFFTGGVALGSFLFWHLTGTTAKHIYTTGPGVSDAKALVGGLLLAIGARTAGGCTSGHGISGMATLSIPSFISVAGMFGGGIVGALTFRALGI